VLLALDILLQMSRFTLYMTTYAYILVIVSYCATSFVQGNDGVLALSSRSWLSYIHRGRHITTPLSYEPLEYAGNFCTEHCPYGIVAISDTFLRIIAVERRGEAFNQQVIYTIFYICYKYLILHTLVYVCTQCHLLKSIVHQHIWYSIYTTLQNIQAIPLRYTPRQIAQLRPAESSTGGNDDNTNTVRIVVVESDADEYNLEEREMLKALDNNNATTTAAIK
jgi:hypothetical protein